MASSTPTNQSEYQLYRVLQRANLLQYYDTFIAQGGDDVQQLCEAGEEEFLEIMALVGMASKPLHVRRLQKALQEWATNPNSFFMPTAVSQGVIPSVMEGNSILASIPQQTMVQLAQANATAAIVTSRMYQEQQPSAAAATTPTKQETLSPAKPDDSRQTPSPTPSNSSLSLEPLQPPSLHNSDLLSLPSPTPGESDSHNVSGNSPSPSVCSNSGSIPISVQELDSIDGEDDNFRNLSRTPTLDANRSSPTPHAHIKESEITALAEAAARLAQKLPHYEPKRMNLKKQICREIEALVQMPMDAPGRLELMRKYGAIYGRFDSKRKNEKPMSLHEVSVNEASAQLCWHRPGLLTRREELFPLARDVVRASGYQYAKGHSRAQGVEQPTPKRMKFTEECQKMVKSALQAETDKSQERLAEISHELQELNTKQDKLKAQMSEAKSGENYAIIQALSAESEAATAKQLELLTEQSDLMRKQRKSHKNRYSKHGIHTVDDMCENGYAAMFAGDFTAASPLNGHPGSSDAYAQDDALRAANKRNARKTQLFVQESLFDEGLRIAQQYGMADFAEEIKGLIKYDNPNEESSATVDTNTDSVVKDSNEINGNYKEESDSHHSSENNHETEGTSSHEQNKLIQKSVDSQNIVDEDNNGGEDNNTRSSGVRVLNIVPLSEDNEENGTDLSHRRADVACS